MESHHVVGEQAVLLLVRPVDEDKDQVEAGEEGRPQAQVLRDGLGAVVVAAHRVGRSQYGRPLKEDKDGFIFKKNPWVKGR